MNEKSIVIICLDDSNSMFYHIKEENGVKTFIEQEIKDFDKAVAGCK